MASIIGGGAPIRADVGAAVRDAPALYPVETCVQQPTTSSRWAAVLGILLPLKLLAVLPVGALAAALTIAQFLAAWYGFWAGLCTGRYPAGPRRLVTDVLRLQAQVAAWVMSYTDAYPAVGLDPVQAVRVEAPERGPGARYALWPFRGGAAAGEGAANRWWAVLGILLPLRMVAALPHYIVVTVLGMISLVLGWIGFWIILFTGRYPRGLWGFDSGILCWDVRLAAFTLGLTDGYPPFRLA